MPDDNGGDSQLVYADRVDGVAAWEGPVLQRKSTRAGRDVFRVGQDL